VLAAAIVTMPSRAYEFIARGDDVESVRDMSGRVPLWQAGIEFGLERPLLGYGAYSGIRLDFGWLHRDDFGYMETNNFDNSYMNVFIETGLVGVALLVGLLVSLTRMSWRNLREHRSTVDLEMFALMLAFLIKSYTGNVVTYFSMTQFYLAFLLVYGASRPAAQRVRAAAQQRPFRRLMSDPDTVGLS
jgi:O-antigen ligase